MTMRKLTVLKPGKYGTRHLTAGEEFEAPIKEAVALVMKRKAKFIKPAAREVHRPSAAAPASSVPRYDEPAAEAPGANIDELRRHATQLGINVDGRWGATRLLSEIDKAQDR